MANSESHQAAFLRYLRQDLELGDRSCQLYMRHFRAMQLWSEGEGYTLNKVPGEVLLDYVQEQVNSRSTRQHIRTTLKHYWAFTKRRNPPVWAARVPKKPRMVCRALADDEAMALAAHARQHGGREGLAVLLAMYQALRREEVASVKWADVEREPGWLHLVGKGNVPAKIPVHPVVAEALDAVPRTGSEWVFPGRWSGRHVNPATVWAWVVAMAKSLDLPQVTPHRLRHTCLATANDTTGDLRAVQDFARHVRPDTTAGYTRTTEKRLFSVLSAISYDVDNDAPLPDVAHDVVVRMIEGSDEHLPAWRSLGRALSARGWAFVVDDDGRSVHWQHPRRADLAASVDPWGTFTLFRSDGNDEVTVWELPDVEQVAATAAALLGSGPVPLHSMRLGSWVENEFMSKIGWGEPTTAAP